ncbi:hypothetical protein ACFSR6_01105 [Pedobacter vanadiisoli]|uniref:SUKH superfamily protein n=1 Tax=Pedobacter vanadiisoli TaxID=1761975 RepID=A0ABW5MEA7_9SPHI
MEIQYLGYLRDNPDANPNESEYKFTIEPIALEEIAALEQLYNNGNAFPKVLKELLFLAGAFCYVLDYGTFDTKQELQEDVRRIMSIQGRIISRPFYAVDVYNQGDQFLFIYLDEGEDPLVYEGLYSGGGVNFPDWIHSVSVKSLSELINHRIDRQKEGRNPF